VNPTLFDYSETTTDWLQHLYRNLGIFQGELRAKVLASIVYELARRGIPVSGDILPPSGGTCAVSG